MLIHKVISVDSALLRRWKMSENSLKEVILCRGITENNDTHNEYVKIFQSAGFTCKHLPVLSFEYLNLQSLKNCLLTPNSYSGLIITSRRSLEAIGFALQGHCLPEEWNNLPTYCVGPATASFAETTLNLKRCLGSECGNSKDLSNYIVKELSNDKRPLLYPCSAIARDTMEQVLSSNQISFDKIIAYNTLPNETLENDLTQIVSGSVQIFVFFSPSTVEYTLNAARRRPHIMDKIHAVAIGPATADALVKAKMIVRAISSKPEPNALLRAIQTIVL